MIQEFFEREAGGLDTDLNRPMQVSNFSSKALTELPNEDGDCIYTLYFLNFKVIDCFIFKVRIDTLMQISDRSP